MRPPQPPFALEAPAFSFGAIAVFAARAPLGGAREIALATYVTARLASDVAVDRALPAALRRTRAAGARRWLSNLALAEPVRRTFDDLVTATEGDAEATIVALRRVIDITAGTLDAPSRSELEQICRELASQPVVPT